MDFFIEGVGHYIPSDRVPNSHFLSVNGLEDEWIYQRTGIKNRSRATADENTNTMAIDAVKNLIDRSGYDISTIDMIIGASYSPYDTVATIAHCIQSAFSIDQAKAVYVSSACSSFINAVEIAETYLQTGKAKNVLIVTSEHNSYYSNDECEKSGHLWGDGAAAMVLTSEPTKENLSKLLDVETYGLGHIGDCMTSVTLQPGENGIEMPNGRDVFIHACKYMSQALLTLLDRNGFSLDDLSWLIPHQANARIMQNIAKSLPLAVDKIISNIEELGNTGCASTLIGFSQNFDKFGPDDITGFTVFGGGYSSGAMLVQIKA